MVSSGGTSPNTFVVSEQVHTHLELSTVAGWGVAEWVGHTIAETGVLLL